MLYEANKEKIDQMMEVMKADKTRVNNKMIPLNPVFKQSK
jgi:hypothetical protein